MSPTPILLTAREVAELLRTSRKAIYTMIERAIQLLDAPGGSIVRDNMMATRSAETGKSR
jgi:hypothetical protein